MAAELGVCFARAVVLNLPKFSNVGPQWPLFHDGKSCDVHSRPIYLDFWPPPPIPINTVVSVKSLPSQLISHSYKLVKCCFCVSVCVCTCVCLDILTRVTRVLTAAHRDLYSYMHRHTNDPWSHTKYYRSVWVTLRVKSLAEKAAWVSIRIFESAEPYTVHAMLV